MEIHQVLRALDAVVILRDHHFPLRRRHRAQVPVRTQARVVVPAVPVLVRVPLLIRNQ